MAAPSISVIIPCYNQASFLNEAIASCWVEKGEPIEILVVDDGSTHESSREFFNHWSYSSVRLIRQVNKGLSAARNTGIREALSDIVIVLDSDDRLGSGFLKAAKDVLMAEPSVVLVGGDVEFFGDKTGPAEFAPFGWPRM